MVKYVYDAWGNHGVEVLDSSCETLANINPFRYRGYYYDTETELYFLKTRYYDPEIGRFMTIDGIEYLDPETINGLNLYAYCGNNPVMRVDPNGNAWWHWLLGAVAVVGLAIATIVSAGGVGAGLLAIAAAANGTVMFGAVTTTLAFATVGSAIALSASAVVAGIDTIETWATGGGFADGLKTFSDYGETALSTTLLAGGFGAFGGYLSYKEQIGNSKQLGFMTSNERKKQRVAIWKSLGSEKGTSINNLQISHIYGTFGNNRNYYILQTPSEHRKFHKIYGYKTGGGPFNRYNPNYHNWWLVLKAMFGI